MAEIEGTFRRPFAEQVAAWRLRMANQIGTAAWDDLWQSQHDRAFVVAGALRADLLADLAGAVDKAIAEGTTLDEFRRDFRRIVAERGWHGWTGEGSAKGEAWRTRVIYQTNLRTSYAAGRHAQLTAGSYRFWVYRHGGSREPRPMHLSWDGVALPPDHPFWVQHYPPNGWGCSCRVFGARSEAGIRRVGGIPGKDLPQGWDMTDPRTGAQRGIDKGWGYAAGASVLDQVSALADKIKNMPFRLGSDVIGAIQPQLQHSWPEWLAAAYAGRRDKPGLVGRIDDALMQVLHERGIIPRSAEILVRPGLINGPKARRHEQRGDALTQDDWLALPSLIQSRRAVLLDVRTGKLVYVLGGDDRVPQFVVDLEYGPLGDFETPNVIVSGYRPKLLDLIGRIKGGQLILLVGELE